MCTGEHLAVEVHEGARDERVVVGFGLRLKSLVDLDGQPQASANELRGRGCPSRLPLADGPLHSIHGAVRLGTDSHNAEGTKDKTTTTATIVT